MKKRMISSILTLCIAVSLVLPVYAADNSVSSKIDQDMEAMRNAFFNVKAITVHSVDNGIITYAYKLTDDVTDYVRVQHCDDGSAVLNVWEEDRNNTLTVLENGTLLFDGKPLKISYSTSSFTTLESPSPINSINAEISRAPGRFRYYYSRTPFPGTAGYFSSEYNLISNPNIELTKKIREETGAIIGAALAASLFPGNPLAEEACSQIFAEIGARLRSRAEARAEESKCLSYRTHIYSCSKSISFDLYRRFYNIYYTNPNYYDKYDDPVEETFFEYRSYIAG